jgi:hypothetical protein
MLLNIIEGVKLEVSPVLSGITLAGISWSWGYKTTEARE